ncbi:MAG TPA: hypothetical protein VIS31_07250, partial [Woeseiaceae bacterium]
MRLGVFLSLWISLDALAGPYVPSGDLALRADIQRLSSHGVISGPVTAWPLAWAPIIDDLRDVDVAALAPGLADAVIRVRERAGWETSLEHLQTQAS